MASSKPRVSILTPTYNHEAVIGACIASVLAQTFSDWEMIVVDDGSTDATPEIVAAYADGRIRLIRQQNKGIQLLSETYNAALAQASGELIAILEGDDRWPADKLERQLPDFDEPEVVLSWGRAQAVSDEGQVLAVIPPVMPPVTACRNEPVGAACRTMLEPDWMTFAFPVTVLMRKAALERAGGFRQPPYMPTVDLATFLHMGLEGPWRHHEEACGYWVRHGESVTHHSLPAIFSAAHRLSAEFAREQGQRVPLSDAELAGLELHWGSFQYERCMLLGRLNAAKMRRSQARSFFERAAIFPVPARSRALAALARALVGVGLSPEMLYTVLRKPGVHEQFARDVDPIVSMDQNPEDFEPYSFSAEAPVAGTR